MPLSRWTPRLAALIVAVLLLYATSYLVWSRGYAWRTRNDWAFYTPPMGLMNFDIVARYRTPGGTLEDGWRRQERLPGFFFRPCIVIDDALTGKRYLPTHEGAMCFN